MLFAVFMFGLKQTKKWIKVIYFKCSLLAIIGILKVWSVAKSTCVSQSQKLDRITTTGSEQETNELSFVYADYIKVLDVILAVTYSGNIILYRKDDFSFFKQVCFFFIRGLVAVMDEKTELCSINIFLFPIRQRAIEQTFFNRTFQSQFLCVCLSFMVIFDLF